MANYTTFIKGGHTDSQATNESTRSAKIYKDLNLFFQKNSSDKDINKVTDVQAVKRSIRNLVLTNHYERPFKPSFGSNLRGQLFELDMPGTRRRIQEAIVEDIRALEPRIGRVGVQMVDENNTLNVTILYQVIGSRENQQVNVVVSRVR